MTKSQNFLPIEDIKNDLVFLKNGNVAMVINTSAVNFALLFETEQISIIESFAGLLNSLSFPIQISVMSRRLDVSSYLGTLDKAKARQTNPLLRAYTEHFRRFVESIIRENNVLDKQFYVTVSASGAELGIGRINITEKSKRAATVLSPRRDHLVKQLARLGIKAKQLNTVDLVRLFYSIYNPTTDHSSKDPAPVTPPPSTQSIVPNTALSPHPNPSQSLPKLSRIMPPLPQSTNQIPATNHQPPTTNPLAPPFVVEELPDE